MLHRWPPKASNGKLHWINRPANLLVVNLRVKLYKPVRDTSSRILPRIGAANSPITQEGGLQPRGHDWFRLFSAALAAN